MSILVYYVHIRDTVFDEIRCEITTLLLIGTMLNSYNFTQIIIKLWSLFCKLIVKLKKYF